MRSTGFNKMIGLRTKINLIIGSFFLFAIISLYVFYKQQVSKTFNDTHAFMSESLVDIKEMMGIVETLTDSGFTKTDYRLLKPFFQSKKYYDTGYPFLIKRDGTYLIHPWKEGSNEAQSSNHIKRLSYGEGSGYFRYVFSGDGRMKWQYVNYFKPYDAYITVTFYEDEFFKNLSELRSLLIIFVISGVVIFLLGTFIVINPIVSAINRIKYSIGDVAKGKTVETINIRRRDQIGEMTNSINALIVEIADKTRFSNEIAKGNLSSKLELASDDDILGKSLINMRDNIAKSNELEKVRKLEVEQQNWSSLGLAQFGDLLRERITNMDDFTYKIVSYIVKYVDASHGGLFLLSTEGSNRNFLELAACYAYNKRELFTKEIAVGEGLVGECFVQKETMLLSDIPDTYSMITSGLGKSKPRNILLVPLKTDENVIGVIELASFNPFEQHVVSFIEKIGQSIASTITNIKTNIKTAQLLEKSKEQAEQMQSQEEELRQNMEELNATHEEMSRREKELIDKIKQLEETVESLQYQIQSVRKSE